MREIFAPMRWDLAGFALSRAHATALLAFAAGTAWPAEVSVGLCVAMLLSAAACALIVALSPCCSYRRRNVGPWAIAAAGCAGVACIAWGCCQEAWPCAILGFALSGICVGYYESVWGRRFVGMRHDRIQSYTLLITALSSLLGIVLGFAPSSLLLLIFVGMLLAGAAVLFAVGEHASHTGRANSDDHTQAGPEPMVATTESDGEQELRERHHRALVNILLCCLVYSCIYNLVVTLAYDFMPSQAASQVRFAANFVTALGLLALSAFMRPLSSVGVLRLVLPVTAVGFVFYLILPQSWGWAALTVSGIGRKLFDILTWVLVAQAVGAHSLQPDRYFGFLIAGKNMGYLMGLLLATVTLRYDPGVIQVVTVVPILLLALIVLFVWVFPERVIEQLFCAIAAPNKADSMGADLEKGVAAVAKGCGCTPRETEVLGLLARGRTQAVIAKRLGISPGTAHSHIVHVYQKLGVGKQQELIEKVESAGHQEEDAK